MRKRFFVFLFFFSTISPAGAAPETGRIYGTVVDQQGNPLPDAEITLSERNAGAFTLSEGEFLLDRLPSGRYTLRVVHLGYASRTLRGVTVRAGETTRLPVIRLQESLVALPEAVVTAARSEKKVRDLSNAANIVPAATIRQRQPKTSAEALREETGIFVQKTNHGGGSAIIRGLSSNQILLLVDGIRLNNSTYRLGNHQYLTTVDYHLLDKIEVVRGPTSVLHGSDALGGTINLITRRPPLAGRDKVLDYQVKLRARHATADAEKMGRAELALFNHSIAFLGGVSGKDYGDLRRGANSGHPALENSTNGRKQSPSGYSAYDADAKLFFELAPRQQLLLAYQLSRQEEVPRYDKYESGKNVLWLYSPQKRDLAYLQYAWEMDRRYLTALKVTASYHRQQEGRVTQTALGAPINRERDDVDTYGVTAQFNSRLRNHLLTYGADVYYDRVESRREIRDPGSGTVSAGLRGRFPDGARYLSLGAFLQHEWYHSARWITTTGLRYSHFDTGFTLLGDSDALSLGRVEQTFRSLTGSLGALYKLSERFTLSANLAQAFRAPNLSDLSKLGESKGSTFEVPNTGLEAEKMLSGDVGMRVHTPRLGASLVGYYAVISDLLGSADATYRGASIIVPDADTLKIKRKENLGSAYLSGLEGSLQYLLTPALRSYVNLTYTYGQNTTLDEPVGGIPPLFGTAGLRWQGGRYRADLYTRFAGRQDRLSADDRDDDRIPAGGTPGWQTYNLRLGIDLGRGMLLRLALENLFDRNYREHGSGINGPGRNLVVGVSFHQ